jgi:hypothetical protein
MKTIESPKLSTPGKIDLARAALANDLPGLSKLIAAIPGDPDAANTTKYFATRFLSWFADQSGALPFSVFAAGGNQKLPFYAFSSLPGFDCPGAGACLYGENQARNSENFGKGWCYSFKGWRYPAAFFRQLQNSVLLRSKAGRAIVLHAFEQIPENRTVRLYVDGDFANLAILRFWMDACKARADLKVYGYSKSWDLFLQLEKQGYSYPANYLLNVSSGSRYGTKVKNKVLQLDCTRGEFIAVPVSRKHITSKAYQDKDNLGSKDYRKEIVQKLRDAGHTKRFACPGNCGNCLAKFKHACGDNTAMRGVTIAIGIHN